MNQSTTPDLSTITTITDTSSSNDNCFCYNRFVGTDASGAFVAYLGQSQVTRLTESGQATTRVKDELHSDGTGPCYTSEDDQTGVYDV